MGLLVNLSCINTAEPLLKECPISPKNVVSQDREVFVDVSNYYLRQGGYVFASVSLCVCLWVCVCGCVCHQHYAKNY